MKGASVIVWTWHYIAVMQWFAVSYSSVLSVRWVHSYVDKAIATTIKFCSRSIQHCLCSWTDLVAGSFFGLWSHFFPSLIDHNILCLYRGSIFIFPCPHPLSWYHFAVCVHRMTLFDWLSRDLICAILRSYRKKWTSFWSFIHHFSSLSDQIQ